MFIHQLINRNFLFPVLLIVFLMPALNVDAGFLLTPSYFVIFLGLASLACGNQKVFIYTHEKILFLFYLYAVVTLLNSPSVFYSVRFSLGVAVFLALVFSAKLIFHGVSKEDILLAFKAGGKFYAIITLILYFAGFLYIGEWSEHQHYFGLYIEKGIPRLTGGSLDPNIAAVSFIPFIFYFSVGRRNALFLILFVFFFLATLSRGAVVALFFGLLVYCFFRVRIVLFIKFLTLSLLAFFLACFLYFFDFLNFRDVVDMRLSGMESGGGRLLIWKNALSLFYDKPIFGWGAFSFRDLNLRFFGDAHFAHNTYLEIMVEMGLVGLLLFILFAFSLSLKAYNISKKPGFEFIFPSVASLLCSLFFLSLYINHLFAFFLVLVSLLSKRSQVFDFVERKNAF